MTPLNYSPKAIEQLLSYECPSAPGAAAGFRYIADKLREAQVFVLSDGGQLLDRRKPRPNVPGMMFRPPFPVVALEYEADYAETPDTIYTESLCPKRIALAWEWQNDLPPILAGINRPIREPGVMVALIPFYADRRCWLPIMSAFHLPFDDPYVGEATPSPFQVAMIETGRIAAPHSDEPRLGGTPIVLNPEGFFGLVRELGSIDAALDHCNADIMDEVNAYADLCLALACKNVSTREHPAPDRLNKQRIKSGRLPLRGFHVLELTGGGEMPGAGTAAERNGPRSHLRRGHIRRLGGDRVTWVNATVVRGRGLVEKVYSVGARRAAGA